ncbi:hypothetical protein GIS00_12050 [Nakamurella sp. YIM 132087]|uniref:Uncharacterized protein n=1 Tax=Nakamurella alba TaxID=2665158 RepID=A0A7K1FKK4_9ACTN|nr:hypothetical protein [Nakamurella alba]MTD14675.1 hypothetical protein [Nakamurella alba]
MEGRHRRPDRTDLASPEKQQQLIDAGPALAQGVHQATKAPQAELDRWSAALVYSSESGVQGMVSAIVAANSVLTEAGAGLGQATVEGLRAKIKDATSQDQIDAIFE